MCLHLCVCVCVCDHAHADSRYWETTIIAVIYELLASPDGTNRLQMVPDTTEITSLLNSYEALTAITKPALRLLGWQQVAHWNTSIPITNTASYRLSPTIKCFVQCLSLAEVGQYMLNVHTMFDEWRNGSRVSMVSVYPQIVRLSLVFLVLCSIISWHVSVVLRHIYWPLKWYTWMASRPHDPQLLRRSAQRN